MRVVDRIGRVDLVLTGKLALVSVAAFALRLTIYRGQTETFATLTLSALTVYQWLPVSRSESAARLGTIWGLSVLALLVYVAFVYVPRLIPTLMLGLATASVLATPFVLPRMHDRYFFAADVFTIILAFHVPVLVPLAVLVQLVSFVSYWPFLFGRSLFSGAVLALFELGAIMLVLAWNAWECRRSAPSAPSSPAASALSPEGALR